MIATGDGHASPNLLPNQFGDLSIEFGGINQPFEGARVKRYGGNSLTNQMFSFHASAHQISSLTSYDTLIQISDTSKQVL